MAHFKHSGKLLRLSAMALAVGLGLASGTALAQSNTTGNAYGKIEIGPGVSVLIESTTGGVKRTVTPSPDGRFAATALPPGAYKASLIRDGKVVSTSEPFEILIGQGSEILFVGATTQTVQVTGRAIRLDMTSSNSGATFTALQLDALPIARNLDAIIQLSPNTTTRDPRYNGGASFGGGAATENSYYINGFPVTNPLTQLGSSELPFGAIGQTQIQIGGFGVEFGRSIGGVVNVISKSGGNTWEGGAGLSITPGTLRGKRSDIYWPNTGANPVTDGKLFQARSQDEINEWSAGAYLGGPLIQDKLYLFVAGEKIRRESGLVTGNGGNPTLEGTSRSSGWSQRVDETDRYLIKADWHVTSNHHLEATLLGDRYKRNEALSGFDYTTLNRTGLVISRNNFVNNDTNNLGVGADTRIFKYTGYLTENLTVQALTGKAITPHPANLGSYNPALPQVVVEGNGDFPGFAYPNLQTYPDTTVPNPKFKDVVRADRIDIEYKLGQHTMRAGIDQVKLSSLNAGDATAGGSILTYARTDDSTFQENGMNAAIGQSPALTLVDAGATFFYYGTERRFSNLSSAFSDQTAQYIEDKYQATKDLVLTFGLRNEQYKNRTTDGQVFLKVKDQLTPRFAFAWDAFSNGSTKIFGTAGRYAVQLPTTIALRGANPSLLTDQVFAYTGIGPDGNPIGRVNLGPPFSANNEYGQPKDLKSVSAQNMKPNMQDELTLGIERALTRELNAGARLTYRKLVSNLDDYCDPRALAKWANDRGIKDKDGNPFVTYDSDGVGNLPFSCATFNPGRANTFLIDFNQDGTYDEVNLSAAELGFPKAKRSYIALDFFLEHPLRDGWYGKVNYTYGRNKGNTEGQTNSDLGQADIAATVTWDHPELMLGAYGYLPNDRRHQIKAYGFIQATPELQIGANVLIASGRPRSCLGIYPSGDANFEEHINYGSYYHYCNGTLSKRGAAGNLPWEARLDMNAVYRPKAIEGMAFRVDVFNMGNTRTPLAVLERYENNNGTLRNSYGRVLQYSEPRRVKFTVNYDKKF